MMYTKHASERPMYCTSRAIYIYHMGRDDDIQVATLLLDTMGYIGVLLLKYITISTLLLKCVSVRTRRGARRPR
jgi:hypothetical protein